MKWLYVVEAVYDIYFNTKPFTFNLPTARQLPRQVCFGGNLHPPKMYNLFLFFPAAVQLTLFYRTVCLEMPSSTLKQALHPLRIFLDRR